MVAVNAVLRAGGLIMEVYTASDMQVHLKSDSTPLTAADRLAHDSIKASLAKTFIPVLSEEGRNIHYDERRSWEYFWIVDPLDGTKEFIKRNGEFTVNIALIHEGFPVMGVIYAPALQTLYLSMPPHGAHRVLELAPDKGANYGFDDIVPRLQQLPQPHGRGSLVVVLSRSHTSSETTAYIELLRQQRGPVELLPVGSSLKMCMLAEGRADIYPRLSPSFEWDTAAGQAIVEGAGFRVLEYGPAGGRLRYNKESLQNPWFVISTR
ncbi:MAG: 3'(2'),5'-bisphosphate nucleotidase CysQ [Bacteroidales bacterium]|nr:3'(2'),5'-bisphosphate nucleotidase CysQ [Bacteroidales bacterium]